MNKTPYRARLLLALVLCSVFAAVADTLLFSTQVRGQNAPPGPPLILGVVERWSGLDPAAANDFFTWEILTHLGTGLTSQNADTLTCSLALAATHELRDGNQTHVFTIRADAVFSDGTPITAQTFADSIARALRLGAGNAESLVRQFVESAVVEQRETTRGDGSALVIRLLRPLSADFARQLFALPPFFPVHPASFPADRIVPYPEMFTGNGMYAVNDADPDVIRLSANPAWAGPSPVTSEITLRRYLIPAALREALKAGAVDVAWRGLPPDDAQNALNGGGLAVHRAPGMQVFYLLVGAQTPFDELSARLPLLHLIDRERAIPALRETALPLATLLPEPLAGTESPTFPGPDVALADSMLAEAGFSRYRRIESELQTASGLYGELYLRATDAALYPLTRHQIYRVGRFDTVPETLLEQLGRGAFRLVVVGLTPLVPHPDAILRPLASGADGGIVFGPAYNESEGAAISALLDQAMTESGDTSASYAEIERLTLESGRVIPLWQSQQTLLRRDTVDPSSIHIAPNYLLRYDLLRAAPRDGEQ